MPSMSVESTRSTRWKQLVSSMSACWRNTRTIAQRSAFGSLRRWINCWMLVRTKYESRFGISAVAMMVPPGMMLVAAFVDGVFASSWMRADSAISLSIALSQGARIDC